MKTFSQILPRLLLLGGLTLSPATGWASETRVDATGGLTTILDDETTDLSLFLDGNPAGLVLLNTKDRFDLAGEWSYSDQEGPWGANKSQVFTTIPRSTDGPIKYGGLMFFPDPHWAVQVLGDAFVNQGVSVTHFSNDTETTSQYRGLVRAAYALPFAALGLEVLNVENDKTYDPGLYNPYVGLASGNAGQNQALVKAGLITTFPDRTSPEDPRWQAGAYIQTQVGSSQLNQEINLFYLNSPSFGVNQVNTTADDYVWGVELFYELPSVLRIRFSTSLTTIDFDYGQTVPFASAYFSTMTTFHSYQSQAVNTSGSFKLTLPFSDSENLKLGGTVAGFFYNQDFLRPAGNVAQQRIVTAFGIGLENPKEYTMGLQWKSQSCFNGTDAINNPGTVSTLSGSDYAYYQLAFGGEKWISNTWAFRLGLVGEVEDYSATSISALTTTIDAGAGVEEAFGRLDLRFWLGQESDLNNQSNTVGIIGAEVSTTLFL